MKWLLVLTLLNDWKRNLAETNPYRPYKQTWILTDGETGRTLNETTRVAPLSTWWPDLIFCFRDINPDYKSTAPNLARSYGFYACPGHSKDPQCGGVQYSFCKSWACVTSNDGDWRWPVSRPDSLRLAFVNQGKPRGATVPLLRGPCSPQDSDRIRVQFTDQGKQEGVNNWIQGKQWGVVFYKYGGHAGSTIVVRLKVEAVQKSSTPVGPNRVLAPPGGRKAPPTPPAPTKNPGNKNLTNGTTRPQTNTSVFSPAPATQATEDPL